MENISQFLNEINTLSAQAFIFKTYIEPLTLLKDIPNEVSDIFEDPLFKDLLDSCSVAIRNLNTFLKPHLKTFTSATRKKKSSQDRMIPYADFKIDEKPIIIVAEPEQLCAEDIIKAQGIKPVNHLTKLFTFDVFFLTLLYKIVVTKQL